MGLQGTIETLPAAEVLIALTAHGSCGVLEIRGDATRLSLSLVDGFLVAGDMAGDLERLVGAPTDREALTLCLVDVLCAMLRIESGSYAFRDGATELPAEARIALDEVLSRASAAAGALREFGYGVPPFDVIPVLAETNEDGPITLNRSMLRLVSQVDSKRSVAEIGALLGLSAFEVAVPIAELITLGVLSSRHLEPGDSLNDRTPAHLDQQSDDEARDSLEIAASHTEVHRSPYTDAAERALADLAGGDLAGGNGLPNRDFGLDSPGDENSQYVEMEDSGSEEGDEEFSDDLQQTMITADRGALLRLFSGLRTDHG